MATRKTLIASVASLALCVAMAGPTIGAAPTYTGQLYCDRASDGQYEALNAVTTASRREIAAWRKYWTVGSGYCTNGSFDTSQLTRDS